MREIIKGAEPASLTLHRATPHSAYDNYVDKGTLRQRLSSEQRGICCYCMSRIQAVVGRMKIEHWHSQARHPTENLDYSNLLGTCLGNEGQPRSDQHCDTYKGDEELSRNPAYPMHRIEEFIRYQSNGRVSSADPAFDAELNDVLNLNVAILVSNRKAEYTAFIRAMNKRGELSQAKWKNLLEQWNGETVSGELRPFCQVIVYWLRKRLRR